MLGQFFVFFLEFWKSFSAHFSCKICYFCLNSALKSSKFIKNGIFCNLKMSKSCWLITPWFKPIPGIKKYAMRLLSFKRVWVALFSSFFYGSFRQATFSHCSHNGIPTNILQNHEKVDFSDFWNSKICQFIVTAFGAGQTNTRDQKVWYEAFIPQKGLGWKKFLIFL